MNKELVIEMDKVINKATSKEMRVNDIQLYKKAKRAVKARKRVERKDLPNYYFLDKENVSKAGRVYYNLRISPLVKPIAKDKPNLGAYIWAKTKSLVGIA